MNRFWYFDLFSSLSAGTIITVVAFVLISEPHYCFSCSFERFLAYQFFFCLFLQILKQVLNISSGLKGLLHILFTFSFCHLSRRTIRNVTVQNKDHTPNKATQTFFFCFNSNEIVFILLLHLKQFTLNFPCCGLLYSSMMRHYRTKQQ